MRIESRLLAGIGLLAIIILLLGTVVLLGVTLVAVAAVPLGLLLMPPLMLVLHILVKRRSPVGSDVDARAGRQIGISGADHGPVMRGESRRANASITTSQGETA